VAEKPNDVHECACIGPRRRVERAELTGLAHGVEREKRDARGNGSTTGDPGLRGREREGARGRRKLAPTDRPHWAASERESARGRGELPLIGEVRLSGAAGARARGLAGLSGPTGPLSLFYRVFNSKFKLGFKFK
jgi:hypothetical protein